MALPLALLVIIEALATVSTATPAMPAYKNSRFLSPSILEIERAANVGGGTLWGAKLNGAANANRNDFLGDGVATTYQTTLPYAALANNNFLIRIDKSTRTGTVAVTLGSNTVTGTATQFVTELKVGGEITINGERKTITTITSATVLTVDSNYVATVAGASCFMSDDLLVPTTDFTLSNVGGFALVTLSAAAKAQANSKFSVHLVVPVALFTYLTATTIYARREIPGGYDVLWYVSDATASPSATNVYVEAIIGE